MTRGRRITLLAALVVVSAACGRAAEITTHTDECAANIEQGLMAFQNELGLPFEVSDGDGESLLAEGAIAKSYARDGMRYEVAFRPQVDGSDCDLVFYRRTTRKPGSRESQRGYFGGYTLENCQCE